ncbi:glycosyltransferase family 4 protein [Candidatus Dojkabacteria bacterium]|nr:glycosyltransferase family 4 protein [Candidatus Dojkabacteria bacterium]
MKKIIFDLTEAQPYKKVKYHGGGNYAKEFFVKMAEEIKDTPIIVVFYKEIPFQDWVSKYFTGKNVETRPLNSLKDYKDIISQYDKPENEFVFPLEAIAYKLMRLGLTIKKAKVTITIHGLRTIELPNDKYEYLYEYPNFPRVILRYIKSVLPNKLLTLKTKQFYETILRFLKMGDQILTDSEYSKTSILLNFPSLVVPEQIQIVYPPIRVIKNPKVSPEIERLVKRNPKYMLFISGNRYEKNLVRVLESLELFNLFKYHFSDVKLVVTGVNTGLQKLLNSRYKNLKSNIILLDYPSLEDLNFLFAKATLFLYPSLNEGFGLPPLEAMSHGIPVIASATTSIPEVTQGATLYINPYSGDDISNAIYRGLTDGELRKRLIKASHEVLRDINIETETQWSYLLKRIR